MRSIREEATAAVRREFPKMKIFSDPKVRLLGSPVTDDAVPDAVIEKKFFGSS